MNIEVEKYLEQFRKTMGEAAWKDEVKRLAVQAIKTGPRHKEFWKELTKGENYAWLDWEALEKEAESLPEPEKKDPEAVMADLLKGQMPDIKSQGQYDAVVGAMDALKLVLNAILAQDTSAEKEAQKALEMALTATRQATELTDKLEDVPEAATSEAAEAFKKPPAEFQEYEIQRRLLADLNRIENMENLNEWYAETKELRDKIVTQKLRNALLDGIRAKKHSLLS